MLKSKHVIEHTLKKLSSCLYRLLRQPQIEGIILNCSLNKLDGRVCTAMS